MIELWAIHDRFFKWTLKNTVKEVFIDTFGRETVNEVFHSGWVEIMQLFGGANRPYKNHDVIIRLWYKNLISIEPLRGKYYAVRMGYDDFDQPQGFHYLCENGMFERPFDPPRCLFEKLGDIEIILLRYYLASPVNSPTMPLVLHHHFRSI